MSAIVLCICCTVGIDVFPLVAELLARGQYLEGPATGHLDTGFSWFSSVFKQMIWFPRFQVATIYFSCSPPDVYVICDSVTFSSEINYQILTRYAGVISAAL
jgi:hypothetical protein